MISFRLSESEYSSAERCCPAHGVRSVSSLARNATLETLRSGAPGSPPNTARNPASPAALAGHPHLHAGNDEILLQLQHQVLCLRAELDRIAGLLGKSVAPTPAASSALSQ